MMITLNKPGSSPVVFINGLDDNLPLIKSLDCALSYQVANCERMPKFQSGEWDGKDHLFKRSRNGAFYYPFGLTNRVLQILQVYGVKYQINGFNQKKVDAPIGVGSFELRQYQIDSLKSVISLPEMSGVLSLPTAAGKTMIALAWSEHLRNAGCITQCLVIVHRMELLNQWRDEILEKTGCKASLIGGTKRVDGDGVYTVAMVQSLYREKQRVGNKWGMSTGLVIFDECHTMPAKTAYSVGMSVQSKYRLGLSATPRRTDGADMRLWGVAGCIAAVIDVKTLVDGEYLAEPIFEMLYPDPVICKPWDSWANVYKKGIVANIQRNEMIVKRAEDLISQGRQVYVHVNHVAHGKTLTGKINGAVWVCGATPKKEREEIIADFKSGKIVCLISTLLKEGVSIDGISALIYAAGGKSEVATIQTIGRALRMDDRFGNAVIIDFIDSGHKFLTDHSEQRITNYRVTYGDLFQY